MKEKNLFNSFQSSRSLLFLRFLLYTTEIVGAEYARSLVLKIFSSTKHFHLQHQGGLSSGYKRFITENSTADETYSEDGLALFRVQGSGPDNMQAIQVEPVNASCQS